MKAQPLYVLLFCVSFLHAEVPFTWMHGISAITNPEHNPIKGMVWAEQQIVDALYRNDNKLVKELFYMQADNVSFRPTVLPSKPASYWKPNDIGKLITAIAIYRHSNNEKEITLLNTLDQILHPQRTAMENKQKELDACISAKKEILQDITRQTKKICTRIGQIERGKRATYEQITDNVAEIKQLCHDQQFFAGTRKVVEEDLKKLEYDHKLIDRALQDGIDTLKQLILDSVTHSEQYTTESILLTLLWKIANPRHDGEPKQDFVDYFNQLGTLVNDSALQQWLNTPAYTTEDYRIWKKFIAIAEDKAPHEQKVLVTIGNTVWESNMPPRIVAAGASYTLTDGSTTGKSANCMEEAFRYFCNIITYNSESHTFDKTDAMHTLVTSFYHEHSCILAVQAAKVCNAWAQVLTKIPGVVYMKPNNYAPHARYYEVKSCFPNMLRICNYLLLNNNPAFNTLSKAKQLDQICAAVSRDDFILSWDIADADVTKEALDMCEYVTLQFFINDTHSFEWQLKQGHSVIPGVAMNEQKQEALNNLHDQQASEHQYTAFAQMLPCTDLDSFPS